MNVCACRKSRGGVLGSNLCSGGSDPLWVTGCLSSSKVKGCNQTAGRLPRLPAATGGDASVCGVGVDR